MPPPTEPYEIINRRLIILLLDTISMKNVSYRVSYTFYIQALNDGKYEVSNIDTEHYNLY